MTFSVVIPAKNEAEHLPALLSSIKTQSLKPDGVIIADAESVDKTREIAKQFGARVVKGGIPSIGRNNGAQASKSDLIFFLDSDVELQDKDFFKKSIRSFKNQKLDIATADVKPINGNWFDKISHKVYNSYVHMWGGKFPHTPGFCILVKKDLHDEINGFDKSISFCEDHEYAHRAVQKGKFGFLNDVVINVSVRRMDKDGRFQITMKYFLAEMHLLFIGPIMDKKFKYDFDHLEKNNYGKGNKKK